MKHFYGGFGMQFVVRTPILIVVVEHQCKPKGESN